MTQPPPPRYRVVERGRRLEVVDTHARGRSARAPGRASRDAAAPPLLPRRTRFDGGGELATRGWYDDRGPRTVALDPASARLVALAYPALIGAATLLVVVAVFWPPVLLTLAPLLGARPRTWLRARVTDWLDTRARENG